MLCVHKVFCKNGFNSIQKSSLGKASMGNKVIVCLFSLGI